MRSKARSERLDLGRDLPTTTEDIEALRRARTIRPLDFEAYLHFLEQIPTPTHGEQRARRGPHGDRPFVLG